jgi:hypothetical protein
MTSPPGDHDLGGKRAFQSMPDCQGLQQPVVF